MAILVKPILMRDHRTRKATTDDMDALYLMGFDVWADGQKRDQYLESCRSSPKYATGVWYVLADADGKPVSSLITYALGPICGKPAVGIGSVATDPSERRKGRSGQLLREVINLFHDRDGSQVFYLWADVDPKYYETFGFLRLPNKFQVRTGSSVMIKCSKEILEALLADIEYAPPQYF